VKTSAAFEMTLPNFKNSLEERKKQSQHPKGYNSTKASAKLYTLGFRRGSSPVLARATLKS